MQLSSRTNRAYFFFLSCCFLLALNLAAAVQITQIDFTGNQLISDEILLSNISSRIGSEYQPALINSDLKKIAALYSDKYYFNIKIPYPELNFQADETVEINFLITEHEELLIDSLKITDNNYLSLDKMQKYISVQDINLAELPVKIKEIINYYNNSGFMFASLQLDSIKFNQGEYYAHLTVSEGKYVSIEEFLFKGNEHSTNHSLLKISQLENYESLTPDLLRQAEERILSRPYIKDCRIYLLDHQRLLIEVKEDRMTYFSGILGYNSASSSSSSLNGFLDVRFLNLFGSDRSLGLAWQKTTSERNSVELNYHESGPFQFPLSADLGLKREEVDSTYIRSEISSQIYFPTLYNKYGVLLSYESIYPGSRRPQLIDRNNQTRAGLFWNYSNVFSANPLKGNELKISYQNIFYKTAEKNDSRYQTEFHGSTYFNPWGKTVLAVSAHTKAKENKDLESYELFTLGGKDDLRGYEEDQFQGHLVFWTNLELRYLLSYNSRFFAFFDYGFVQKYTTRSGKLFATGIGLRIATRLGLLGIDYGIGYENGKFRNPLDGIIHFGLETKL